VLGLVLGQLLERGVRRTLILSERDLGVCLLVSKAGWQVPDSASGGDLSQWRRDGKEIFTARDLGELATPVLDVIPIQARALAADDAHGVVPIARPAGEEFVDDQVFSAREGDALVRNWYEHGMSDRRLLEWRR
jgi:hypothetical protein